MLPGALVRRRGGDKMRSYEMMFILSPRVGLPRRWRQPKARLPILLLKPKVNWWTVTYGAGEDLLMRSGFPRRSLYADPFQGTAETVNELEQGVEDKWTVSLRHMIVRKGRIGGDRMINRVILIGRLTEILN